MRKIIMKKITAVFMGMLLTVSLLACGSQDNGSNASQTRQEEATTENTTTENTTEAPIQSENTQTERESQPGGQAENSVEASGQDSSQASAESGKTLVVYYSATGNTESVAGYIAAATDADIFVLEPVEPYSSDDLNWRDDNSRVAYEYNNPEARNVELVSVKADDWESYDTVFIGYPIWWGIAAWPVDGFIAANDFTGKTVIPFCTSASSNLGKSGELLAEAAGTGNWLEGERFASSASEETVREWVESLNLSLG